ncbi:hypothetical protein PTSG_04622 [Salpingoeca rosetta]|uniref:Uncharacterized protein n=1 Tax=Salpingoeca rosetta (strain ATCC 50818 / BSB-021) TaxID=946362 RepID=F2U7Y8_SALR5|nr:uncharacterized protein PTSG_04622 [Salpingoeca rosetta]EGD72893.1 hypothetical protein PTSG_04622 [Salpingoeca rosetta]|eukprot:XP_004994715.1 hypothetical protein PTSG_04622 [Salpingoeca rosetta]
MHRALVLFGDAYAVTQDGRAVVKTKFGSVAQPRDTPPCRTVHFTLEQFCSLLSTEDRALWRDFVRAVLQMKKDEATNIVRAATRTTAAAVQSNCQDPTISVLVSTLARANVDVQPCSLATKLRNLPPDEPSLHTTTQALKHKDGDYNQLLNAYLVWKSWQDWPREYARRLLSTHLIVVKEAASNARLRVDCYIPPQSKDDDAFITLMEFEGDRSAQPHDFVSACKSIQKDLALQCAEVWASKARFMVWYCNGEDNIHLSRLFTSNNHVNDDEHPAEDWARVAFEQLKPACEPHGFRFDHHDYAFTAPHKSQWILLVVWDPDMHSTAADALREHVHSIPLIRQILREHVVEIVGCAEYSHRRELLASFTPEAAAAIQPRASSNQSLYTNAVARINSVWDAMLLPHDQDGGGSRQHSGVTAAQLVVDVGFTGDVCERLLKIARRLDSEGCPGYTIRSLAISAVWNLCMPMEGPLIGDDILLGADGAVNIAGGDGRAVHVYHRDGCDLLQSKNKQGTLLEQLPSATLPRLKLPPPKGETTVRLFHGTTRAAATAILQDGIEAARLGDACDFGKAFCTTTSFPYAVQYAYDRAVASSRADDDMAILVFDLRTDKLPRGSKLLTLRDSTDWKLLLEHCRRCKLRQLKKGYPGLHTRYSNAELVIGNICGNATQIETRGANGARPLMYHGEPVTQHAFRPQHSGDFAVLSDLLDGDVSAGTSARRILVRGAPRTI